MSEILDWDSAYRQEGGVFEGPPPRNIGEPQPEIAELTRAGKFRSDVLDVGIDVAPTAIAAATAAATERGLNTATYVQADITSFTGYDGGFSTILDSTLFHSLPFHSLPVGLRGDGGTGRLSCS
jgi:hypothetical protein